MGVGGGYHEDSEEFLVLLPNLLSDSLESCSDHDWIGIIFRWTNDRDIIPILVSSMVEYSCLLHRCQ